MDWIWKILAFAVVCFGWVHWCIFLHELGHAGVGHLAGFRIQSITVGKAPHLRLSLGSGRQLLWGLLPSYGMVRSAPSSLHRFPLSTWKWRSFAYLAGGPAIDLLLLIALIVAIRRTESGWLAGPLFVQISIALGNLLRSTHQIEGSELVSDAAGMAQVLSIDYPRMFEKCRHGIRRELLRYGEEDLSARMAHVDFLQLLASSQVDRMHHRFPKAIEGLKSLSEDALITDRERSLLLDQMASIALEDRSEGLLLEAMEWIERALELNPDCLTLRASKGSVLLGLARFEEAKPVLEQVLARSVDPVDQAQGCLDRAEIAFHEGEREEAARWLSQAREKSGSLPGFGDRILAVSVRWEHPLPSPLAVASP